VAMNDDNSCRLAPARQGSRRSPARRPRAALRAATLQAAPDGTGKNGTLDWTKVSHELSQ
jgi:hypothetical protein